MAETKCNYVGGYLVKECGSPAQTNCLWCDQPRCSAHMLYCSRCKCHYCRKCDHFQDVCRTMQIERHHQEMMERKDLHHKEMMEKINEMIELQRALVFAPNSSMYREAEASFSSQVQVQEKDYKN